MRRKLIVVGPYLKVSGWDPEPVKRELGKPPSMDEAPARVDSKKTIGDKDRVDDSEEGSSIWTKVRNLWSKLSPLARGV